MKGCILEVDLEYPKESHELHNNYPLVTYKLKTKRKMLSDYNIDDNYISVGNVKKLVPKPMCFVATLFPTRIKNKKLHCVLQFDKSKWLNKK